MSGRRLRVLHVINGLGTGGAERSLAEMLPLMDELGVDSRIACLSRKADGVHASVEDAGWPVDVVGAGKVTAVHRIRRLIAEWSPDVVHTAIFEADVLGRLAAAGRHGRVVTSLVNTSYDGVRRADSDIDPRKLAMAQGIDKVTARLLTDHFHAISGAVRDSAVTHLGIAPERISVIERGRSLDRLGQPSEERRASTRAKLGIPHDAEVVLNVGRQEPQKAHLVLLEACRRLAETRPRLVLVQAGRDGKSTPEIMRMIAREGLASRTRLLGHRDDVGDLLAAADVFAFPSVYEGLGGSVLEAMAMRLPVVVTDVPALVEVVEHGHAGRVVPIADPGALAEAIEDLLSDRQGAEDLSGRAQEVFLQRFTLERSVSRMVQMYDEVVGAGAHAGRRGVDSGARGRR